MLLLIMCQFVFYLDYPVLFVLCTFTLKVDRASFSGQSSVVFLSECAADTFLCGL